MDPPPLSNGGQPDSYTSCLPPGSGEQSNFMSDYTAEMDPVLALPSTSQEQEQCLPRAGSLDQAPVRPPQSPSSQDQSPNAPFAPTTTHHHSHTHQSQQPMWHTPPPGDDIDHFLHGDSPTCGSCTSNSNLSSVSPAGTWPSPATSFQQPPEQIARDIWEEFRLSTPASMDGCSGDASDISPPYARNIPEPLSVNSSEWHCEPLEMTTAVPEYASMTAASCPASPAEMPPTASTYLPDLRLDSPESKLNGDLASSRASEPPIMEDSPSGTGDSVPYAQLIYRALMQQPGRSMTLQAIYQWFQENTDKCKPGQRGWMNSIRHNLSMNAGFTKRDRKQAQTSASVTPEVDGSQSHTDPKPSTEWTLTDEAIADGIQSTTRYRNKKQERENRGKEGRDASRRARPSFYRHTPHGLRHGLTASGLSSTGRSREYPSRVSKGHRYGGHIMRMAPTSNYVARGSSPARSYYHDAFLAHAAGQNPQIKMDRGVASVSPSNTTAADTYGLMLPEGMLYGATPRSSAFDVPGTSQASPMYLGPPPPPQGPFPYDTTDVHLGYPGTEGATDASRSARLFDVANIHDEFCWPGSHGY